MSQQTTKVIFLDIDGVVNTTRSMIANRAFGLEGRNRAKFDYAGMGMLKDVCDRHNVKLVICSVWRKHGLNPDSKPEALSLYRRLEDYSFVQYLHDDWRTIVSDDYDRATEISEWLSRHPEIVKYAVVDDDTKEYQTTHREFCVHPKCLEGLSVENYRRLNRLLEDVLVPKVSAETA